MRCKKFFLIYFITYFVFMAQCKMQDNHIHAIEALFPCFLLISGFFDSHSRCLRFQQKFYCPACQRHSKYYCPRLSGNHATQLEQKHLLEPVIA